MHFIEVKLPLCPMQDFEAKLEEIQAQQEQPQPQQGQGAQPQQQEGAEQQQDEQSEGGADGQQPPNWEVRIVWHNLSTQGILH